MVTDKAEGSNSIPGPADCGIGPRLRRVRQLSSGNRPSPTLVPLNGEESASGAKAGAKKEAPGKNPGASTKIVLDCLRLAAGFTLIGERRPGRIDDVLQGIHRGPVDLDLIMDVRPGGSA